MDPVEAIPTRIKRAMERVLIIDPEHTRAENLKEALMDLGFKVSIHADQRNAVVALAAHNADAVVIVPGSRCAWMKDLKHLREALTILDDLPEILCLLHWPSEGPADRLYGEQLDVKVLHER
jgi:DNA-binding NtrC family response regulator